MYADRERLEQIEVDRLAPYALLSRNSEGRCYPDDEPPYRTAFQRDRDRIVHAAAFRQLEYKTQVFENDEGDYYRTRLTHTLEVAQIGRTVARALLVNEDLVETICLAHDLGHPPFGHAGEDSLNDMMQGHGGFNHNFQSYRIVTELERRYADFPGLNLTRETLAGIAKHETNFDLSGVAGLDPNARGSVEAQIADICDSLAYNAHDLDDGLQAGLIHVEDLDALDIWRALTEGRGWKGGRLDEIMRHSLIRDLIGIEVDDLLKCTVANLGALNPQSPLDIQNHPTNVVEFSEPIRVWNSALKRFLYDKMYYHSRVIRMKVRAARFIADIFHSLVDEPRQLPEDYQANLSNRDLYRVIADYIAGMTDRGALLEYRRLYDPLMRP